MAPLFRRTEEEKPVQHKTSGCPVYSQQSSHFGCFFCWWSDALSLGEKGWLRRTLSKVWHPVIPTEHPSAPCDCPHCPRVLLRSPSYPAPPFSTYESPVSFKSSGNLLQSPNLGSGSPQHMHITLSQNNHMKWIVSVYTSACLTRGWGHQGQNWILFTLASNYPDWCQHIVGIQ